MKFKDVHCNVYYKNTLSMSNVHYYIDEIHPDPSDPDYLEIKGWISNVNGQWVKWGRTVFGLGLFYVDVLLNPPNLLAPSDPYVSKPAPPANIIFIPITINMKKCECGVAKVGGIHSHWCPVK